MDVEAGGSADSAPDLARWSRTPVAVDQVLITDTAPARVRRSLDLVRLAALLSSIVVLCGLGIIARETSRGANDDLARLLGEVPNIFIRTFSLLASFGALAVPLAFMVREIVRGQTRRLAEALLTGLIAIVIVEGLDRLIAHYPTSELHEALTRLSSTSDVRPLDTYLAALLAFVAVTGVANDPLWRILLIAVTAVYVLSVFTASQASLLSLVLSLVIGATVGIAFRYIAGSVNFRPTAEQLVAELGVRGVRLAELHRVGSAEQRHRNYRAVAVDGAELTVHVLDRDLIASGAIYNIYRLIRIRKEVAPAPALSLERIAEHRTLLSLVTAAAHVPVPAFVAGVRCGPDAIVLVYEDNPGIVLRDPTPAQLDELWQIVTRLHRHRVTHRGVTAGRILVQPSGELMLPIPEDGTAFATDLRIALDRVQLLVTSAQLAGAEQAVRSARHVLTDDELAAAVPVLQPIALTREIREAVRADGAMIEAIRDQIATQTHQPVVPELARVERVRPRTIISIVAVIVAGYLIVGQLGSVDVVTVLRSARWRWVPLVVIASALTYLAAALSLTGYVRERLSFSRTVAVQLAASFAGFVTPPAVGGLAVNIRYLRKARVSIAGAATSVGLSQVVNAVSHVALLIAFAAATGASAKHSLPIPGWAFGLIGALVAIALLLLAVPAPRHWLLARVLPPLREALPRLLNLLTNPTKLAEGVVGALLLNGAYIAALWFSVRAFGGGADLAQVAVVYLAGAAIGSIAPTPGGLGAVEVALSTGLAASGMPSAAAVSAVLLFRLATFWAPVPLGWIAFHVLQRRDVI